MFKSVAEPVSEVLKNRRTRARVQSHVRVCRITVGVLIKHDYYLVETYKFSFSTHITC